MKHIKTFESFLNEAEDWDKILKDLGKLGWKIDKDTASKNHDRDKKVLLTLSDAGPYGVMCTVQKNGREIGETNLDINVKDAADLVDEVMDRVSFEFKI
jgi:hypothetical protein